MKLHTFSADGGASKTQIL